MGRYDVYNKKSWPESRYKKASIRNDVSTLTNDTINMCNTLYDIAEGFNNLKNIINNPNVSYICTNTSNDTQDIAKNVSKIASNSIYHIGKSSRMIQEADQRVASSSRKRSDRLTAAARELERI